MGIKQFLAYSCSNTASDKVSGSTLLFISYILIFSTPAPIPISIAPSFILEAIIAQASKPELHNLFTATTEVVSGIPDKNAAILA
jgi:hypothetical protein